MWTADYTKLHTISVLYKLDIAAKGNTTNIEDYSQKRVRETTLHVTFVSSPVHFASGALASPGLYKRTFILLNTNRSSTSATPCSLLVLKSVYFAAAFTLGNAFATAHE